MNNNFNTPNSGMGYGNQPIPQQPVTTQQPMMQQPVQPVAPVQQPMQQPINPVIQPPQKSNKGLIIGIVVAIVIVSAIVAAIIFIPKQSSNSSSTEEQVAEKEVMTAAGKIPYNKKVNSCAITGVEYKDKTRNLCDNPSEWFNSKTQKLVYGNIDYNNISFYLNTDESNIISYTRTSEDKYGYKFLSTFKDDSGNYYVYLFYEMERGNYIYVTSSSTTGILSQIDFTNKTQKELSKNKKLDVPGKTISGYYGSTYRMNKKYNDLELSIIHLGESDAEIAYQNLEYFSGLLSLDNGAPFLFDLVINHEKVVDYNLKSYKYITKLSTESNIRGEKYTDLHYSVTNKGIYYEFADTYSYMPDFFTKYEVYMTSTLTNNKSIHGTYIPEDNEFLVVIELMDKYYASNADTSLGAEYYINNFTEMFSSSDGQGFKPVEKYQS